MSKEAMKLAMNDLIAEYHMENSSFARRVDDIFKEALVALADLPAQQEPDCVLVPRVLIGAACSAIDRKRDAPKTLEQLRRYTVGDLSAPQPAQRKPLDAGEISRLWKQHTNQDGPHHNPYDDDGLGFARAIEAAHDIKENT